MPGPLQGLRVVELQGRGPGPFGTMVLADLGAEVVAVTRVTDVGAAHAESPLERMSKGHRRFDLATRGKKSLALDLKHPDGVAAALRLAASADVLVESFRPGVAERLGLGPDVCLERNPGLVYARITGWGQDGPYAHTPGHDVNYVALAGALEHLRRPGQAPMPPLNLLGDYGGGGMLLVAGVLAALWERSRSGKGQVIDAAMVDGVALLSTLFYGLRAEGLWSDEPQSNTLDLGAPHYNVYDTADGRFVSVGAGEPQFYRELLRRIGVPDDEAEAMVTQQTDRTGWAAGMERLAEIFRSRTQAEWCRLLEGSDTCFAPVLSMSEAPAHAQNEARRTFVEVAGTVQPAAAPRFSRTVPPTPGLPAVAGQHSREVLVDWGFGEGEIDALITSGAAAQA